MPDTCEGPDSSLCPQTGAECRAYSTLCKGQWQLLALEKQEKQIMQSQAPTC